MFVDIGHSSTSVLLVKDGKERIPFLLPQSVRIAGKKDLSVQTQFIVSDAKVSGIIIGHRERGITLLPLKTVWCCLIMTVIRSFLLRMESALSILNMPPWILRRGRRRT